MGVESLKTQIHTSMVATMRAQDKAKLGVIRLIQAEIKQKEVDERITLEDPQVLKILDKMIRQRRDSIQQYEAAKREDLAQKEAYEIKVIQEFLPSQLTQAEIETLIKQAIAQTSAQSIRDMAKVMEVLKPQLQGRADIGAVGALVKGQLQS